MGPAAKMRCGDTRAGVFWARSLGKVATPHVFVAMCSPGTVAISHNNPVSSAVGTVKLLSIKCSHRIPKVWKAFRKVDSIVSLDTNSVPLCLWSSRVSPAPTVCGSQSSLDTLLIRMTLPACTYPSCTPSSLHSYQNRSPVSSIKTAASPDSCVRQHPNMASLQQP